MTHPAYALMQPKARTTSVIFASPHSGRDYSDAFLRASELGAQEIRSSEDAFVDLLYADAPDFGAPFLTANAPRAFLDLNRGADEMDAALIAGVRRVSQNPRVASGLGVVPRVVANGLSIYRGKLTLEEVHTRIANFWRPYHDTLQTLVDQSHAQFGEAILIDCHSMPSHDQHDKPLADFVLGDLHHSTLDPAIGNLLAKTITEAGYSLAWNHPYAGGYITKNYGRAATRQQSIQIEINRRLYMTRKYTLDPQGSENITALLARIGAVLSDKLAKA